MDKLAGLLETELSNRMEADEFFVLNDWFTFQYNVPLTVANLVPIMNKLLATIPNNPYYFKEEALTGKLAKDSDYIIYNKEAAKERIKFGDIVAQVVSDISEGPAKTPV